MKRILISGANGYIGVSLHAYMENFPERYSVEQISLRDESWKLRDLSGYDVVVHAAGLAHIRETSENAKDYYRINRDLAVEFARKARADGVSQFVFLSSASVYGLEEGVITKETMPAPVSAYGASKLQAEEELKTLNCGVFRAAILRPPMVYGDGCKGNYQMLVKIARYLPVFADYKNQRSAIHVDALSKFICRIIDEEKCGVYFPQDPEFMCTCETVRRIAEGNGKRLILTPVLNPFVAMLRRFTSKGKKAFGDLIYADTDPCVDAWEERVLQTTSKIVGTVS